MSNDGTPQKLVPAVAQDRESRALAMRVAGKSFAAIGKALGITPQGAHHAYKRALEKARVDLAEAAADHIQVELGRLDRLVRAFGPKAYAGDKDAAVVLLKVMERKARLLGLDAAAKAELSGPNGGPLQHEAVRYVVQLFADRDTTDEGDHADARRQDLAGEPGSPGRVLPEPRE